MVRVGNGQSPKTQGSRPVTGPVVLNSRISRIPRISVRADSASRFPQIACGVADIQQEQVGFPVQTFVQLVDIEGRTMERGRKATSATLYSSSLLLHWRRLIT